MIVCPNCDHPNPEGATQCEACYTPLPATASCPYCEAPVQTNSTFCGQCGAKLEPEPLKTYEAETEVLGMPAQDPAKATVTEPFPAQTVPSMPVSSQATIVEEEEESLLPAPIPTPPATATRLQLQVASLLHVQTNKRLELPQHLSVVHIGKPNDHIPPDLDVSGFPDSEIVSRVHADIRVEGDSFYLEDTGSSNGTYVNHTPLPQGNRHRLRPGDRIALGKGDKVTFLFQLS